MTAKGWAGAVTARRGDSRTTRPPLLQRRRGCIDDEPTTSTTSPRCHGAHRPRGYIDNEPVDVAGASTPRMHRRRAHDAAGASKTTPRRRRSDLPAIAIPIPSTTGLRRRPLNCGSVPRHCSDTPASFVLDDLTPTTTSTAPTPTLPVTPFQQHQHDQHLHTTTSSLREYGFPSAAGGAEEKTGTEPHVVASSFGSAAWLQVSPDASTPSAVPIRLRRRLSFPLRTATPPPLTNDHVDRVKEGQGAGVSQVLEAHPVLAAPGYEQQPPGTSSSTPSTSSSGSVIVIGNSISVSSNGSDDGDLPPPLQEDEGISVLWNFQHNIHVDEGYVGILRSPLS
ncbi:hypothetical protein BDZ97DRAFT_1925255 [Flammula alnicola]|nr:hypothetical protein BDZ97DRAFT_1925255 [Flammula alnicola]